MASLPLTPLDTDFPDDMPSSNAHEDADAQPHVKPRSRRAFELSSEPPTPVEDGSAQPSLQIPTSLDGSSTPSRTRSILNLTSSTLFGIYQPTGYGTDRDEPSTPWGTGAQTPADGRAFSLDFARANIPDTLVQQNQSGTKYTRRKAIPASRRSQMQRRGFAGYLLPLLGRNVALSLAGVLYGLLIAHLHDDQDFAPVKVELDRSSWTYLTTWGVVGVVLGQALPWIDTLWAPEEEEEDEAVDNGQGSTNRRKTNPSGLEGWMDVVRSIGVFVGIAFAIRKLPWQSTLQLSLTLALSNPAVWYLIDRSAPGLLLSSVVALGGTGILLGINPTLIPSPSPARMLKAPDAMRGGNASLPSSVTANDELVVGLLSQESVGVVTWIASVFFVSSVCFGNIGRRLAS